MARSVYKTSVFAAFLVSSFAAPQVRFGDNTAQKSGCGIQNGEDRQDGDSWGASDGCNTCSCTNGLPSCTLQACNEEPPCRDTLGNFRQPASVWEHVDGCNQCRCRNGIPTCTRKFCDGSCIDNQGNGRENGSSWDHEDGCNNCWCLNGLAPCTLKSCQKKTILDGGCLDSQGNKRENGSLWTHEDGCNNCWCLNGLAPCTRKFCQVEPIRENLPNNKCVDGCPEEPEISEVTTRRSDRVEGKENDGSDSKVVFST